MIKQNLLLTIFVFLALAVVVNGIARGAENDYSCGALTNAYGPLDYRTEKDKLGIVEGAHFTPEVENLKKGKSGYLGGDLDYTLRAFPNHHRALMAMMRYGEKLHSDHPPYARYSIGCYFNRALRFRSDDDMVRMIYANYLSKKGRKSEAIEQLKQIQSISDENANLHYNVGLVFFDLKDYEKSLAHAHKAYGNGFPLPGLRDKLKRVGKWKEQDSKQLEILTEMQKGAVPLANE